MNQDHLSISDFDELPARRKSSPEVLQYITDNDLRLLLEKYGGNKAIKEAILQEIAKRDPNLVNNVSEYSGKDSEYPALNTMSSVLSIVGWLFLIGGIIGGLSYVDKSIFTGIMILVSAVISSIMSFAAAEMIKVMTNISSNTHQILKHLKSKDQV